VPVSDHKGNIASADAQSHRFRIEKQKLRSIGQFPIQMTKNRQFPLNTLQITKSILAVPVVQREAYLPFDKRSIIYLTKPGSDTGPFIGGRSNLTCHPRNRRMSPRFFPY